MVDLEPTRQPALVITGSGEREAPVSRRNFLSQEREGKRC